MKNIYSQILTVVCFVLCVVGSQSLNAQQATVTYTSGAFDCENGWQLVDATTNTLTAACYGTGETGGATENAPLIPGNTYELRTFESFGDTWNGSTIALVANGGFSYGPQDPGTMGNGSVTCGAPATGDVVFTFVAQQPPCEMTCAPSITVNTAPGTCESGPISIAPPTFDPAGCNEGVAGDFTEICGPTTQLNFGGLGLITTQFDIPGVAPLSPAITCVTEICVDVLMIADIGGNGFEQTNIVGEDGTTVLGQNATSAGDCNPMGGTSTVCMTVADYNTWAADGTLSLFIVTDNDIDNICVTSTIEGCVQIPGSCQNYLNDYNGMQDVNNAVFPQGTTVITYSSTASGTGDPIQCQVSVTVVDGEAPTINCPGDATYNLQGGECAEILTFDVSASDNCPAASFAVNGPFCDPCADPTGGSALACSAGPNSIIQAIDLSGITGTNFLSGVCFNQETFGTTTALTVNVYCDEGIVPFQGGPQAPIYSEDFTLSNGNNGSCVCLDFTGMAVLPSNCSTVWVEFVNQVGRSVQTPPTCDGNNATGMMSYIYAPACGLTQPSLFSGIGFTLDASYQLLLQSTGVPVEQINVAVPPGATLNAFESGDEFPIGTHCFAYQATDATGNTSTCSWCYTVNEFPEEDQVTSIACNDIVNVSLDEACSAEIGADMFLEGGPYGCYETDYEVYISGFSGDLNGAFVPLDCGTTYTVTVVDVDTGISCWGEMLAEDKLPPVVVCADDVTLNCLQSTDPGETVTGVAGVSAPSNSAVWSDATTGLVSSQSFTVPPATTGAVVTNVTVDMQLSHSWIGDLDIFLTGPDGTVVQLVDSNCGANDNVDATFDDNANNPISCAACFTPFGSHETCQSPYLTCATINNQVQPASFSAGGNGLAAFSGQPLGGDWTLQIFDNVGGDGGCLESFAINLEWAVPAAGSPTIANACGGETMTYSDQYFDNDCEGSFIQRTWIATDECGNSGSCVQTITITQIGADGENSEWFWPENPIDLTCGASYTPDDIYEYFSSQYAAQVPQLPNWIEDPDWFADEIAEWECNVDAAGVRRAYPYFINTKGLQQSFLANNCNMLFTYDDLILPACGSGCNGNNKVIRTWTALDWCTAETRTAVQVIHAKDNEAPTFDLPSTFTVSASPWGCAATFYLPVPEHLHDNCSADVTYRVYGKPGTVAEDVSSPYYDAAAGAWRVDALPKDGSPHEYIYEASDCCGNLSTSSLFVTVVDGSAPIAVAKQNIVISLTSSPTDPNGGLAKLFAHSVDNGSHDGDCGPVRIAVRRTDDESCNNLGVDGHNNNSTFFNFNNLPNSSQPDLHDRDDTDEGEYVKFCCADLTGPNAVDEDGDGVPDYALIDVELGVWDDANMDGVPGTVGDLFGLTWATVRVEAKLQPQLICPPKAMITCDMDENDDFVIDNMLGRATASSTCGALPVTYEDICGLDLNQNGEVANFVLGKNETFFVNESGVMWDVNGDGFIASYTAREGDTVYEDLFNKACHYGPLMRVWSIEGTNVSCTQIVIISEPTTLFDGDTQIDWPYSKNEFINLVDNDGRADCNGDGISNDVSSSDITLFPDNNNPTYAEVKMDCIDALCEEPAWVEANCALIGWTLDSDTFYFEGDACRKIINTYTVIDWCQYDVNNPFSPGIWTWTVIGKLIDPFAPEVTAEDDMFDAVPGVGGSGTGINEAPCVGVGITMSATATDKVIDADGDTLFNACPSQWIKWNVYLDINDDWVYEREWSSFVQEDRNTSTDPLWSEDNAADNIAVYGYPIPDVRVGNRGGVDNADDLATEPGFEYTINIPDQIPADCGETQHRVVWKAYDGCGNVTSVTSYFTVQDKKAPTPYCINLSTALMADPDGENGPLEAMVELWAIDFDAGSFDNCTEYENLRFTFTDTPPEADPYYNADLNSSAHVFTCEDLNGASPAFLTLPIYVWDECGNYDFCLVNLRLVDNQGGCGIDSSGSMIAGLIETPFGSSVENVEVMNEVSVPDLNEMKMTDNSGNYMFDNQINDLNYELTASKNDDYLNGVSTLDLLLIQRHILGIEQLDDPYKFIAADVNNDNEITAVDLIELRKLILGIYDELPNNGSWRFADANQVLDINDPWNLDETIQINALNTNMMHEDFVGIKIGDVNESVTANTSATSTEDRSASKITVNYTDREVSVGELVELTVSGSALTELYGYQFTMNTAGLELVSVQAGAVNVTDENFASLGSVVTTSWNSTTPVSTDDALFTMTFKAATSGMLSEIFDINSKITKAEAYVGSDLSIVDIDVENTSGSADFALYQNEPNPFTATTVIGFVMPEAADATFTVYDVTGKVITVLHGNYNKGYNEIELSKSDLGAAGVLYYQLDSGDFTATKKMIIIE